MIKGFAGFIFDARIGVDPVHLPGLAAIGGEGLFRAPGVRRHRREDESNQDRSAIERFLVVKLTAAVLELADHRLAQGAGIAAGEVQAPLAGLGIVKAEGEELDMSGGAVQLDFREIAAAIPNLPNLDRAVELDPVVRSGQRMLETRNVYLPGSDLPVKIVLPVVLGRRFRRGRRRIRLSKCPRRQEDEDQGARHQKIPDQHWSIHPIVLWSSISAARPSFA